MSKGLKFMEPSIPSVFISYSHDSEEHKLWVKNLSDELKKFGIKTIIDHDTQAGTPLELFINNGIKESQFVLCVCSDNYVQKANTGKGGVGYEISLLTQELLIDVNNERIVPIMRNNRDKKMPTCFGTKKYIDFNDDSRFLGNLKALISKFLGNNTLVETGSGGSKDRNIDKKSSSLGNNKIASVQNENHPSEPFSVSTHNAPNIAVSYQDLMLPCLLSLSPQEASLLKYIFQRQQHSCPETWLPDKLPEGQELCRKQCIKKNEQANGSYIGDNSVLCHAYTIPNEVIACICLHHAKLEEVEWGSVYTYEELDVYQKKGAASHKISGPPVLE